MHCLARGSVQTMCMSDLYIIGGCNGAGKTTSAMKVLPQLDCMEYVNADSIAAGLSPFHPSSVAMQSSRLMIQRIRDLSHKGISFAFESTLASRSPIRFIAAAHDRGYQVHLHYFMLSHVDLAIQRVADRVRRGGHNIPLDDIIRRYHRSRNNCIQEYLPIVDTWMLWENSGMMPELIADDGNVYQKDVFATLLNEVNNDA